MDNMYTEEQLNMSTGMTSDSFRLLLEETADSPLKELYAKSYDLYLADKENEITEREYAEFENYALKNYITYIVNKAHTAAKDAGWWSDLHTGEYKQRDYGDMISLTLTELVEYMDYRVSGENDDHLPQFKGALVELADIVIRTSDQLGGFGADGSDYDYVSNSNMSAFDGGTVDNTLIFNIVADLGRARDAERQGRPEARLYLYSIITTIMLFYPDVSAIVEAKMEYNKTRLDHKREARLAPNGKKV